VNVLIGLLWPAHESHARVQHWSARCAAGLGDVPFYSGRLRQDYFQSGLLTRCRDPAGSHQRAQLEPGAPFPQILRVDLRFSEAVEDFRDGLVGHRQVTDAYLLGLAVHNNGKLAALDPAGLALLPAGSPQRERAGIISRG